MYLGHFEIQDFKKDLHKPYIRSRQQTNVLNDLNLDLQAKEVIIKYIVKSIKYTENRNIRTRFHALWAMEFLGYAFSLSVSNYEII